MNGDTWGGTYDRVLGVKTGLDLAMPGPEKENSSAVTIVESVNEKKLDEKLVDRCVENVLKTVFKAHELIQKSKKDPLIQFGVGCKNLPGLLNRYHEVAREVAENSIVLLKNEDSLLPLPKTSSKPLKILYVGEFAKEPYNQGAGSARVKPFLVSNCYDESLSIVKDTQISIDYSISYDT